MWSLRVLVHVVLSWSIYTLVSNDEINNQLVSCLPIQKNNILVSGGISEIKVLEWCKSSYPLVRSTTLNIYKTNCTNVDLQVEKQLLNTIKTTHQSSKHHKSLNLPYVCGLSHCILFPPGVAAHRTHEVIDERATVSITRSNSTWAIPVEQTFMVQSKCYSSFRVYKGKSQSRGGHKIASHLQAPKPCACLQAPMLIELVDVHVHMP